MKQTYYLHGRARQNALQAVQSAPEGWRVIVEEKPRSLSQNAKFHAMCEDIARSGMQWAGVTRDATEWKVLLISGHAIATKREVEVVRGLEGELVSIRESSADMRGSRMSSLIEYTLAWCAEHGIELTGVQLREVA